MDPRHAAGLAVLLSLASCKDGCSPGTSAARSPSDAGDAVLAETVTPVRPPYDAIAIAGRDVCVREVGGRVGCWGKGEPHVKAIPGWTRVTRLRGGARMGALFADGTVHATGKMLSWDDPFEGSEQQRALTDVADFGFGAQDHACASFTSGEVACWGAGSDDGKLGRGTEAVTTPMPRLTGLRGVEAFALGASHSCALITSGVVSCWGSNEVGQLGDGAAIAAFSDRYQPSPPADPHGGGARDPATPLVPARSRRTPGIVTSLAPAVEIVAGAFHTCARSRAGTIACWGNNERGQLGAASLPVDDRPSWAHEGSFSGSASPVLVTGISRASAMAAASFHTCAVIEGERSDGAMPSEVWCWGSWAAPGSRELVRHARPERVQGPADATKVALGYEFDCALQRDGKVYCWGRNPSDEGQPRRDVPVLDGVLWRQEP